MRQSAPHAHQEVPMLRRLALGVVVLSVACGGGNSSPAAPSTPTVITPPAPPAPPPTPQPTIPNLSGTWTGSHELQIEGQRAFGRISVTLEQLSRTVRGTWQHVQQNPTPG